MSQNNLLMQMQADLTGIPVLRPCMLETTALGVAIVGEFESRCYGVTENPRQTKICFWGYRSCFVFMISASQAEGIDLWENRMEAKIERTPYVSSLDKFLPRSTVAERNQKFNRWKEAILRTLGWANVDECRRIKSHSDYVYGSVPGAVFICSSFLLCKIAAFLQPKVVKSI